MKPVLTLLIVFGPCILLLSLGVGTSGNSEGGDFSVGGWLIFMYGFVAMLFCGWKWGKDEDDPR